MEMEEIVGQRFEEKCCGWVGLKRGRRHVEEQRCQQWRGVKVRVDVGEGGGGDNLASQEDRCTLHMKNEWETGPSGDSRSLMSKV